MKIIKNKFTLSIFFITLMLMGVIVFGAKNVSALEDSYEENDNFGSAYTVGTGFYPNLYQGDEDWFNISVNADDVLKVSLEFNGDQNKINIELYNSSEEILDEPKGMYDNKTVAWISLVPQVLYIRIFGENNYEAYNMTIEILVKGTYDDSYEENDDFPQASEIFPNYYNNLVNNDTDIYKLYLDKNVSIDVFNTSALTVGWYNVSYDWLADFSLDDEDDYLILDWNITYTGYYYIVVNGPDLGDFYDIDIWLTEFMGDDWAEPNDYRGESHFIGTGYHGGLIQNDEDWFGYEQVNEMETLEVKLYYDTAFVLNIELLDESGIRHGYSVYTESWGKRLEWTAYGYYSNVYIHINGSDIGLEYNFELSIFGGSTEGDDWAEENDYFNEARPISFGWNYGMVQNDDDWFEVWLEPHDDLKINIFYGTTSAEMNVELFDDNEIYLASGNMEWDRLHLSWINGDYGRHFYFKVSGDHSGDWYDIELILNGQMGDDWAEENDDWNSARDIDTGYHNQLFNFDDDYYRFHLKEGDSIKVFVHCNQHTSMWLEEISSDDGTILNTDSSTDDGFLELYFYADNDQDIIFAIKGDNYGEWYDLEINFDGEGDEKNGDDPFPNFDLSSIPGFPIEIVGSSFILSSLALIFIVKKKKH